MEYASWILVLLGLAAYAVIALVMTYLLFADIAPGEDAAPKEASRSRLSGASEPLRQRAGAASVLARPAFGAGRRPPA